MVQDGGSWHLYLQEHRDALGEHPKLRIPGEDDAGWRKVVGT